MSFRDLDEFLDDRLELPIGGKTYTVPPVDAATGLAFERLLAAGLTVASGGDTTGMPSPKLDNDQELNLYQRALGPVYAQMMADGVPWARLKLAGMTAFMWTAAGREMAEQYWNSGGQTGEAPAPNRSARRASKATGAARTTLARGSTSGTRSRRTPSPG